MPSFDQLISRVVERRGFSVVGCENESLLARRGEESLLVAWKRDGPVTSADAQMFVTAVEQIQATSAILIAPRGAEAAAREHAAAAKGVEMWAESRLVVEVGEALVKTALEAPESYAVPTAPVQLPGAAPPTGRPPTRFPSLIAQAAATSKSDPSSAAYFMPSKPRTRAEIRETSAPLAYAWSGLGASAGSASNDGVAQIRSGRRVRQSADAPSAAAAEYVPSHRANAAHAEMAHEDVELMVSPPRRQAAAAPTPILEADDSEEYEIMTRKPDPAPVAAPAAAPVAPVRVAAPPNTLRPSVLREEAEQKVNAKIGGANQVRLTLVPHVAFEYDARMERPGMPLPVEGKGVVLASSLTGELRTVEALVFADDLPVEPRKEAEKLLAVDVYDRVRLHLTRTYTKEMRVEREVGGTQVFENGKFTPTRDELGLQHRGVVHVPVWEITGTGGVAKVDGISGAVY